MFYKNIQKERISFTTDLEEGIKDALVVILALPTPSRKDYSANLDYVFGVARDMATKIKSYKVIVNKSTVPVGTA